VPSYRGYRCSRREGRRYGEVERYGFKHLFFRWCFALLSPSRTIFSSRNPRRFGGVQRRGPVKGAAFRVHSRPLTGSTAGLRRCSRRGLSGEKWKGERVLLRTPKWKGLFEKDSEEGRSLY
jgi:hypothetical protein